MNMQNKSLVEIHIAVLLFGMAGLFGKLISLPSIVIVFGRVLFSSIFLFSALLILKQQLKLKKRKDYIYLLLMGIVLAVHWITFFKSIQLSTVAIGLLTFSTFPVFVVFLEPYFFRERLVGSDVIVALITFAGVTFVVPDLELSSNITKGALLGILSGFTYALLSVLNGKYTKEYSSLVISFYEQAIAALVLLPSLLLQTIELHIKDILLLILLGVIFTAVSHTLFIKGLKKVKAHTASIISSLEPIYGIIFAALILNEVPTFKALIGGSVILGSAFYSTIKTAR